VRAVQDGVDLGKNANQKISQWPHGQFVQYLSYKAKRYGIRVEQIPEDYSTRTCSCDGSVKDHAPLGRVYACPPSRRSAALGREWSLQHLLPRPLWII